MGHPDAARTAARSRGPHARHRRAPLRRPRLRTPRDAIALREGRAADAARHFERAIAEFGTADDGPAAGVPHPAARAHLAAGQPAEALAASRRATRAAPGQGHSRVLDGIGPAGAVVAAPRGAARQRQGRRGARGAGAGLALRARAIAGLSDEGLRRNYLNKKDGDPRDRSRVARARARAQAAARRSARRTSRARSTWASRSSGWSTPACA